MNRLLIIDGSNLLFQMFFGMPSRIVNRDGKPIQGTLGFVGALLKIIRRVEPTHIIVFFDGEHKNERTSLDTAYKANRVDYSQIPEEETPFSQLNDIYTALDFMGIKHIETADCEADDMIAAYTLRYGNEMEIMISSLDSDFFQLITDKVSVLRYRGVKTIICTPDYISEKFDITPEQYADFKSLTGDTSDNIKGADKVGPKTAALLLNEFASLENIISHAENIKKPSIRDSIIRNAEKLRINYKIIKLGRTLPLPFKLDNLKYNDNGMTTNEILSNIGLK